MTKNKYTTLNLGKLKQVLNDLQGDNKPIALALYDELLFIQETLESLKQQVRKEGAIENFKQGKQEFLREHPALKAYNATIARYLAIQKQLLDLLPKEQAKKDDELLEFLGGD